MSMEKMSTPIIEEKITPLAFNLGASIEVVHVSHMDGNYNRTNISETSYDMNNFPYPLKSLNIGEDSFLTTNDSLHRGQNQDTAFELRLCSKSKSRIPRE